MVVRNIRPYERITPDSAFPIESNEELLARIDVNKIIVEKSKK